MPKHKNHAAKDSEFILASKVVAVDMVHQGLVAGLNDWVPLKKFGCYVHVSEYKGKPALQSAPMLADGSMEFMACDVTDPGSQAFLDAVNAIFDTKFTLAQF